MYYLDANAHVKMSDKSLEAYISASNNFFANPSSPSLSGRKAAYQIESSRENIANLLGAKDKNQIIFTSSCTQACAWAIKILENIEEEIYTSPFEHPAVKKSIEKNFTSFNTVNFNKGLEYSEFKDLSCCMLVQNEIGTIQDLSKIKCNYLFSDISQAVGKIKFSLENINVAAIGPHKFGGPVGIGILYLEDPQLWTAFDTGSRYFLDRSGTIDVPSICATEAALKYALDSLEYRNKNMIEFTSYLEPALESFGCNIICKNLPRSPNVTFAKLPKSVSSQLLMYLDDNDISIGLGSACGSMYTGTSPTMKAIGETGTLDDYIRISQFGEYNKNDAEKIVNVIEKFFKK